MQFYCLTFVYNNARYYILMFNNFKMLNRFFIVFLVRKNRKLGKIILKKWETKKGGFYNYELLLLNNDTWWWNNNNNNKFFIVQHAY